MDQNLVEAVGASKSQKKLWALKAAWTPMQVKRPKRSRTMQRKHPKAKSGKKAEALPCTMLKSRPVTTMA